MLQDSQTKLFTPAAPRPSPDGAGENEETDPGGTRRTTVGYNSLRFPEEFENTALFLRLGLPTTLIRLENATFCFRVDGEHFENVAFRQR